MSKDCWYEENNMKRNPDKYLGTVTRKSNGLEPNFKCDNTILPLSNKIELLGVTVDNRLKIENHPWCLYESGTKGGSIAKKEKNLTIRNQERPLFFVRTVKF